MLDEPPIPDNELPDDALTSNAKARKFTSDQPISIDASADPTTYNIERIIKTRKGRKEFLVKWEGYGPEYNSWVHEEDIIHLDSQQTDD